MDLILGIDPGRDKTGFAFVKFPEGDLIASGIFRTDEKKHFLEFLSTKKFFNKKWLIENFNYEEISDSNLKAIFIGNGTTSKNFFGENENNFLQENIYIKIFEIDEKNTTLEARNLYWKIHKPNLFKRFLPRSMRVPSRKLDDLAAWAIVLKGLNIYGYKLQDKL